MTAPSVGVSVCKNGLRTEQQNCRCCQCDTEPLHDVYLLTYCCAFTGLLFAGGLSVGVVSCLGRANGMGFALAALARTKASAGTDWSSCQFEKTSSWRR